MLRSTLIIACTAALLAGVASAAERVTPDYLVGTWSLDGKTACGTPNFEHIVFDRDGGFRNYRRGRLLSAGLWHMGDEYLEFHIVSGAAKHNPELKEFLGYFSMASIDAMETKVEKNRLELAVKLGDKMAHWELDRCKK